MLPTSVFSVRSANKFLEPFAETSNNKTGSRNASFGQKFSPCYKNNNLFSTFGALTTNIHCL
jgi:hypothetical protein